ncbi:hypothetical protein [Luteibacter sp. ME-Dv--P-043b]|uniref:hypothetical protein n=1 Tax=Luteibacter sp. ME-Dv--P-043b TaxID=3040291 RepID=UPI002552AF47|nr:hypothetical protein [Luteibacter sp. ME-Dv--P-043b]
MSRSLESYADSIFRLMPCGVAYYAMLAGGCFRSFYDNTPVKDYDLFFSSHMDWEAAVAAFRDDPDFIETTKPGEGGYPSFVDKHGVPFNVIGFRFHTCLSVLAESFDFRCCAMAAWLASEESVVVYAVPGAVEDATSKVLNFQKHQHIDRTSRRAGKYIDTYGYAPGPGWQAGLDICRNTPRGEEGAYTG